MGETSKISYLDNIEIEKPFGEDELIRAIWSCGVNKSLDPDGFTIKIIKKFWDIVRVEMLEAYNEFALSPKLPKGVNVVFITLIPKVKKPKIRERL